MKRTETIDNNLPEVFNNIVRSPSSRGHRRSLLQFGSSLTPQQMKHNVPSDGAGLYMQRYKSCVTARMGSGATRLVRNVCESHADSYVD